MHRKTRGDLLTVEENVKIETNTHHRVIVEN